jgi:hypothetical protein
MPPHGCGLKRRRTLRPAGDSAAGALRAPRVAATPAPVDAGRMGGGRHGSPPTAAGPLHQPAGARPRPAFLGELRRIRDGDGRGCGRRCRLGGVLARHVSTRYTCGPARENGGGMGLVVWCRAGWPARARALVPDARGGMYVVMEWIQTGRLRVIDDTFSKPLTSPLDDRMIP